jgi:YqjK-like protein
MKVHAKHLARKRYDLQMRCALQRQQLGHVGREIEARLATADRVIGFASAIAKQPIILIAAVAGTLILGPWRVLRWASHGALLFSAARKVQQLIAKS